MSKTLVIFSLLRAIVVATSASFEQAGADDASTYMVHVAHAHAAPPAAAASASAEDHLALAHYTSFLQGLLPSRVSEPAPSLIYAYSHAATGFAARLTRQQAAHVADHPGVLAVVPDMKSELHTTLSPSFLGLSPWISELVLESNGGGTGAVIAVLDSGIYPEDRRSFAADPSLPPPPSTFLGSCVSNDSLFNATSYCNNKLVGAKFFYKGYVASLGHSIDETGESMSPLDTQGHGTHTASIAAGSPVVDANFLGYARGTAQGMAVRAHIAVYKVCWGRKLDCYSIDILKGMDEAIKDGVDVISLSLGGFHDQLYYEATSIGSFNAMRKGIVVSTSAGNDGPNYSTVNNLAPWMITVGASSINRRFPAKVFLGNGQTYVGTTLYPNWNTQLISPFTSLVYGGDAGSNLCEASYLSSSMVTGKIVLCDYGGTTIFSVGQQDAVRLAGGVGTIISSKDTWGDFFQSSYDVLPTSTVSFPDFNKIRSYAQSAGNPTATIVSSGATIIGSWPSAPRVAAFSSRGPNRFAAEILKPDVIAPGVDILAAWTKVNLGFHFNIISGTSMACPHVSGIAAMLKVARPSWSPAAIKSALMTTAYNVDNNGNAIKWSFDGSDAGPFESGSGHVDPNRALDPGLVYDATAEDYIAFLCGLGYTPQEIAVFTNDTSTNCSTQQQQRPLGDHNYPAFSVNFRWSSSGGPWSVAQRRAVTNVGFNTNAVYYAEVAAPPGTTLTVDPTRLEFDEQKRTLGYKITVSAQEAPGNSTAPVWGWIVWTDLLHTVRSPVVVAWK